MRRTRGHRGCERLVQTVFMFASCFHILKIKGLVQGQDSAARAVPSSVICHWFTSSNLKLELNTSRCLAFVKSRLNTICVLNAQTLARIDDNLRVCARPQIFQELLPCNLIPAPQPGFVLSEVTHSCTCGAQFEGRKWYDLFSDTQHIAAFQIQ